MLKYLQLLHYEMKRSDRKNLSTFEALSMWRAFTQEHIRRIFLYNIGDESTWSKNKKVLFLLEIHM